MSTALREASTKLEMLMHNDWARELVQQQEREHLLFMILKEHVPLGELWKRRFEFLRADQNGPAALPDMSNHSVRIAWFDGEHGDFRAVALTIPSQFKPQLAIVDETVDDRDCAGELFVCRLGETRLEGAFLC